MDIGAVVIGLPDLDQRITYRVAVFVEDATGQPSDLADRGRDAVIHDNQIIIGIERQMIGVERSLGLLRRARQCLSESARHREQRGTQGYLAEEITTGLELGRQRGKAMGVSMVQRCKSAKVQK